jgi:hypothetical protein
MVKWTSSRYHALPATMGTTLTPVVVPARGVAEAHKTFSSANAISISTLWENKYRYCRLVEIYIYTCLTKWGRHKIWIGN